MDEQIGSLGEHTGTEGGMEKHLGMLKELWEAWGSFTFSMDLIHKL
jgi:hypothetical protein